MPSAKQRLHGKTSYCCRLYRKLVPSANQRLHGTTRASAVGCTGSWYLSTNKRLTGRLGLLLKVVREAGVVCYLLMHGEIRFLML